jgi:hypothetical protein
MKLYKKMKKNNKFNFICILFLESNSLVQIKELEKWKTRGGWKKWKTFQLL